MSSMRGPETDNLSFAERRDRDTEPWTEAWLCAKTSPDLPETVALAAEIREVPVGEIDVLTGLVAISDATEFGDMPAVDAAFAKGRWLVSVLASTDAGGGEVILAHRLRHESGTHPDAWAVATRGGRVPMLGGSVLVGDWDAAAVIGTKDPDQRRMVLGQLFSPFMRHRQPDEALKLPASPTALLTRDSTARSYRADLDENKLRNSVIAKPTFPLVWLGRASSGGDVVEIVIDCLVAAEGRRYSRIFDSWGVEVAGPGGTLAEELAPETRTASNFSAAFVDDGTDFQGALLHVGAVNLAGRLAACDPGTREAISLPIDVPEGNYPVFTVVGEFADLILVRLSGSAPSSWHGWAGPSNEREYIPIDTGTYALLSQRLLDAASADPHLAADLAATWRGGTPGVFDMGPGLGGAVVNGWLGGDVPAWVMFGLDDDQNVAAIAVALVNDYELGNMPPELDPAVLDALQEAAVLLGEDEDFAYSWGEIQRRLLANGGVFSRQARADAYNLLHSHDLGPATPAS